MYVKLDSILTVKCLSSHAYKSLCERQNVVMAVCDWNIVDCVFGRWVHVLQMAAKAELPSPEKTEVSWNQNQSSHVMFVPFIVLPFMLGPSA